MKSFKLLPRLCAVFGLAIILAVSGWGATAPTIDSCGMFPSVLTAQNNIEQDAGITCSVLDPGNVNNDITVINTTTINASNVPGNTQGCTITAPPPPIVLPTFLQSSNRSYEQSISENTTITDQDAKSLKISSNNITVTFTANQTYYTDSAIKVMKIGTVNDQGRNGVTYVFNEGDYWIQNWNMTGNDVVIKITGRVRLFIGNNFTANTNNLNINVAPDSGVPSNLYVYGYNDISFPSSGSANYNVKGYFYAANNFVANGNSENQYFTGAIRAGNNISLGSNQKFYYDSSGAGGNAENCSPPNYNLTGPFDAWDTFRSVSQRKISTKIVKKDFQLTIGSLDSTGTGLETKGTGVMARYRLIDTATGSYKTPEQTFDANAASSITSPVFNSLSASKNARVEFKYCADYNGTHFSLKADNLCSAVCSSQTLVTNNSPCFRKTYSTDALAIRPNEFYSTITANQLFIAGENTSLTFRADAYNVTTGATDYNETEHSSFIVDVNISDSSKICQQPAINFSPNINFANGVVTADYTLNNVGDFNVTMHEISGAEYAIIDVNDPINVNDTVNRLITPYTQNIKVIPNHFAIVGKLSNGSNGFTYLNNFDGNGSADQNISALLDTNITAKTLSGTTASNYTSSCYAKDGNISLAITLPTPTPSGHLANMIWYDDINNSIDGSFTLGTPYTPLAYSAIRFVSGDSNGTGNVRYRINFDRNQTMLVDPFAMTVNEVNATDTDSVDGNQILTANNSAYYVYGRIIPRDIRVFGANTSFTANGWYEVYNASAINGTSLPASRNDASWYTNTLHSDTVSSYDGDATVTVVNTTSTNYGGAVGSDGMEDYIFPATYSLGGYKAHINTDPWLWYGMNALPYLDPANATNLDCLTHPCFNINIVPPVGATGSARTLNEGGKASKVCADGAGTWKSTCDYAPAVR